MTGLPKPLVALVVTSALLGLLYSVTVPLWEAPDEVAHFAYVSYLVENRSLPRQAFNIAAQHPPLYYALAALLGSLADFDDQTDTYHPNPAFIWSGRGGVEPNIALHRTAETFPYRSVALAAHLARLVSVAACVTTVVLTYAIARRLFPDDHLLALGAAALTGFNPQFLFIGSSISPDVPAAMAGAATLWQLLKTLDRPSRWQGWALTGLWCGVAMLFKASGLVLVILVAVMLILTALRRRSWRLFWQGAGAAGLAFVPPEAIRPYVAVSSPIVTISVRSTVSVALTFVAWSRWESEPRTVTNLLRRNASAWRLTR